MRYRYTVRGGYDRLIKKKVEKGTLFAVPIAIMAIVGLAALTSHSTSGPGIGSASKGTSGQSTVTKTFAATANNQPNGSSADPNGSTSGTANAAGGAGTAAQGGSVRTTGTTSGSQARSIQPSGSGGSTGISAPTGTTSGGGGSVPSGSGGGGTTSGGGGGTAPQSCLCQALSPVTSTVQPVLQTAQNTTAPVTSSLPKL
jgi:hypothetical protein